MPNRDVSQPYVETNRAAEGVSHNRAEDEPDLEGYDESQRAEIAEVEGDGPNDGIVETDMLPDLGEDLDDDEIENGADTLDAVLDTNTGIIE